MNIYYMIVTDIVPQKKNSNRYSVYIDGEFAFGLVMQDILYFKLKENHEISEKTYTFIRDHLIYVKAQDVALNYIGYKMRTTAEVYHKLKSLEYSEDVIEKVQEFLEKYHYTDDLQYSKSYIKNRQRSNPRSCYALKFELRQKGVKDSVIEQALALEQPDEYEAVLRLLKKKVKSVENLDEKGKKRIFGFLQRRGYSYDIIKEALQEFIKENFEWR